MTSGNNVGNVTARKEHQHGLPVNRGRRARAVAASMRTPLLIPARERHDLHRMGLL